MPKSLLSIEKEHENREYTLIFNKSQFLSDFGRRTGLVQLIVTDTHQINVT